MQDILDYLEDVGLTTPRLTHAACVQYWAASRSKVFADWWEAQCPDQQELAEVPPGLEDLQVHELPYLYEGLLGRCDPAGRASRGAFYTPAALIYPLVNESLSAYDWSQGRKVVDFACGAGSMLLVAYDVLCKQYQARCCRTRLVTKNEAKGFIERIGGSHTLTLLGRKRVLSRLQGMDTDDYACLVTRFCLAFMAGDPEVTVDVVPGNSLTHQWAADAHVISNPPWGAEYDHDRAVTAYPSVKGGTKDSTRPFVDLALQLAHPGGRADLLLPETLLMKRYQGTRRMLALSSTIQYIYDQSQFAGITMDTIGIGFTPGAPPTDHLVRTSFGGTRQDFFQPNEYEFNLHVTTQIHAQLAQLSQFPVLGDHFEVHEGVHTGNMRRALLSQEDKPDRVRICRAGSTVKPFAVSWDEWWLNLDAFYARETGQRANIGQPAWYNQDKALIRRTGSTLQAAVDHKGLWCTNNLFLALAKGHPLNLHGLCALLNSPWYTALAVGEILKCRAFGDAAEQPHHPKEFLEVFAGRRATNFTHLIQPAAHVDLIGVGDR